MPKPFRVEAPRHSIELKGLEGLGPTHIRVAATFTTKRAFRAMAWNEHCVIAHGPQALRDAGNQGVVVALWKVRAANAAGKQHIANKRTLDLRGMKLSLIHI